MAYICAVSFANTKAVGESECVDLVKSACHINTSTRAWQAGEKVVGNFNIQPGTAIATFAHGHYPDEGGHAAIYLGQDSKTIHVKQQYRKGLYPKVIHEATIRIGGKGTQRLGDDANNYYVVQ